MPDVKLSLLQGNDEAEYTAYLQSHPASLIYSSLSYKNFLEDLLGCESSYWIAREGDRVTGVLPVMWMLGPVGRVVNSLPFYGSNGGVLASTPASEIALVRKFEELASARDVASATWITHPFMAARIAPVHDLEDERISQITRLTSDRAELLEVIDGSARRNIRKAQSEGVTVRIDNDAFAFLERAHRAGMNAIGGNAKSPDFFAKVPRHFKANRDYRIYVAEHRGEPCAALLLFYFNRTIEYFTPATLETARTVQPMALVLLNAMLDGAADGYTRWNWGGTWISQENVFRFKQKWGADSGRYKYYVKLNGPGIKRCSQADLLGGYPGFYVVPFSALETV